MNSKLLSIIIPAYNASEYIEECLCSLEKFMGDDLEIVVIDDGSTDDTAIIVNRRLSFDTRIRFISVKNGGVSKARNIGLKNASGKYIMFLDADDYLLSDSDRTVRDIIAEDKYDFVAFSREILEADGRKWEQGFPFSGNGINDKEVSDRIMYTTSLFNECWGKLFRKAIIDNCGLSFPVGVPIGEDLMFVLSYYAKCASAFLINTPLVAYRQHEQSAMRKYDIEDRLKFTQNIYKYSEQYISQDMKKSADVYYFKVLTNLCREYADHGNSAIKEIYNSEMCRSVISKLSVKELPVYKRLEYVFVICRLYRLSSLYYLLKKKMS